MDRLKNFLHTALWEKALFFAHAFLGLQPPWCYLHAVFLQKLDEGFLVWTKTVFLTPEVPY